MSQPNDRERPPSPKRLQQEDQYEEALYGFARRYAQACVDDDEFMRFHYIEEAAYTIALKRGRRIRSDQLERELSEVMREAFGGAVPGSLEKE